MKLPMNFFVDRPVGIDLGTTNSEVAILDPSERDLLVYADKFGRKTVPSAVAWDPKKQEVLVGRKARARRGREPGPIESIKRSMGQQKTVALGPRELSPEEISALILGELRECMLGHLREGAPEGVDVRVERAVITVPAYFDAPQMEATRKAGELAELEVLGLLQEPTAAAIYHTWRNQLGDGNFLVYDLGGGTFDVSILRCTAGEYQVLAIDGDNYLGGDDFDRRYAEVLRQRLVDAGYTLDLDVRARPDDLVRHQRLVHLAQEIKENLSTKDVVSITKDELTTDQDGEPITFEAEIGRAEYEEAVADLVATTVACCERAIARATEVAGVGASDIDHVVLVGGSTRVPAVIRAATEKLCAPASIDAPLQAEVDTCVALGAAVHAAQLGGLRLGTEGERRAQVLFTSPLVARKDTLRLALEVEAAPDGTTSVAVLDDEGPLADAPIESVPSGPLKLKVPLGEDGETRVRLALRGRGDAALAELPFALYRGDLRPRASGLSTPSVVAKDIAIEVVRAGRRERKVLIARGAGLPASAEQRFFTSDKSGAVVLRLLQNRLPIKTLVLEVPEGTEVGTSVDLTLTCDETMRIEAKAVVLGQELWAQIEPARLEVPKSAAEVETLLGEADEVARKLWGRDAHAFRREYEPIATGLREILLTDPDKAAALTARLQLLVAEFKDAGPEGLSPPLHRFEAVLDTLRRTVYRQEGPLLGIERDEWEARIASLDERGRDAWQKGDAAEWRRVYNEAQALRETATEQEFAAKRLDDPAYLQRRMMNIIAWTEAVRAALAEFVPSSNAEVRQRQLAERDRLAQQVETSIKPKVESLSSETGPKLLRRTLDQIGDELERIEVALERLPQLGLVSER